MVWEGPRSNPGPYPDRDCSVAFWELTMNYELIGICGCKVSGDAESLRPGEVIVVHLDGTMERRSVFEVATDPATAGEREFAIFECLRRSELARCPRNES